MTLQKRDIEAELPIGECSASKYALIVAAGSGQRAGGGLPKQFHLVGGVPMLWYSVRAFLAADPETHIVLILSEDGEIIWGELVEKLPAEERAVAKSHIRIVRGGSTRTESVQNALNALRMVSDKGDMVAIHDAARPMVTSELISRGWAELRKAKSAIPLIPLTDSIRIITETGTDAADRSQFRAVQTPQYFYLTELTDCYDSRSPEKQYTDDASVAEDRITIHHFEGDPKNIKVTQPYDFEIAEVLLSKR